MKQIAFALTCMLCSFAACKKTGEEGVWLRVQNNTSQNFIQAITNNKTFLNVDSFHTTEYQQYDKVIDAAFVILITNTDTAYAGHIYIDPPYSYLQNGKYTLKVFEDTSAYYGLDCEYIKN